MTESKQVPREDKMPIDEARPVAYPAPPQSSPSVASRLRGARTAAFLPDWLPIVAIILSLTYYYAVPPPLLALPGLLAFIILAWLRLDLALSLLPLTFPFWFVPKRVAGNVVFPLSEIALGVCLAVALARGVWSLIHAPSLRMERGDAQQATAMDSVEAQPAAPVGQDAATSCDEVTDRQTSRMATAFTLVLSQLRLAGAPVLLGAALLLAGTALGVVIALRPHEALRVFRWEVAEPLLYAALVLVYLRRRHVRLLVGAFLGTALLLAALAAVQVFWLHTTFLPVAQQNRLISYTTPAGTIPRATAFIFGSGNTLGAWLARALPLALALALAPRGMPRRWRLSSLIVALACVPALLWSDSRGALIAAVLACAVVALLSLPHPRWAIILSAAGALMALVALLANRAAVLNALITGHNGSGEVRTLVWLAAWHMIRDHPLLGIGPDQFLYYYSSLYTTHPYWILYQNGHRTLAWTEPNLAQPHNLLLDLWLSGGLLALAGFLILLAAFWLACRQVYRAARASIPPASSLPSPRRRGDGSEVIPSTPQSSDSAWSAAVALGLAASVLAGILHGMVDSAYFEPDLALLFWWAVAALVVAVQNAPSTRQVAREAERRAKELGG